MRDMGSGCAGRDSDHDRSMRGMEDDGMVVASSSCNPALRIVALMEGASSIRVMKEAKIHLLVVYHKSVVSRYITAFYNFGWPAVRRAVLWSGSETMQIVWICDFIQVVCSALRTTAVMSSTWG